MGAITKDLIGVYGYGIPESEEAWSWEHIHKRTDEYTEDT